MKVRLSMLALVAWAIGCCPAWAQIGDRSPQHLLGAFPTLEEVHVWGGKQGKAVLPVAPTTEITALELESINLSTIEDAVAYEPNMVVRRRFIGDANGSLGIRGANMFQTARTMVYADGLPLHYHLQTRWSGAPRWSLIAPDEVESVEVVYGPFSALYPGNAMGGVVRIKTRTPTERSVKLEGALFNQFYRRLATEEDYSGGRFSLSYGDTFDDLTVFAFYNRLQNQGQPQTQYFTAPSTETEPTPVTGAVIGTDSQGDRAIFLGDSGTEASTTDLIKLKTGYSWQDYQLYTTLAYEDRHGSSDPNNYLRNADGEPVWSGAAQLDEFVFNINSANFGEQQLERQSLLMGVGLTGPLIGSWEFDLNVSHFQILHDIARSSMRSPADPDFTGAGRLTEYGDTGWRTLDFHSNSNEIAGRDHMKLTFGAHYGHYQLNIQNFNLADYASATTAHTSQAVLRSESGGETATRALFTEYAWQMTPAWDISVGARFEHWQAQAGYVDQQQHPERTASGLSPKFSLGFMPGAVWELRYSAARALRFPLVEELYQNESRAGAVQTANPGLAPEDGLHHNFMIEKTLGEGYARINLFHERVSDTIFNQLGLVNGVEISTFLAIDEVTTQGAEFILNQPQILHPDLDVRFNVSYLEAEITRNRVNPALEGNRFPRMPNWQSNLLVTYRATEQLNLAAGIRYASDSFGELDNVDSASQTFGAHDRYVFLNLRAGWQTTPHLKLAVGMDNMTDEVAYVHHPWPARTLYLEAGYEF